MFSFKKRIGFTVVSDILGLYYAMESKSGVVRCTVGVSVGIKLFLVDMVGECFLDKGVVVEFDPKV